MKTIPYKLGWSHGVRKLQPFYTYFTPVGCFEDLQYRQGYIDGCIQLQTDIEQDKQYAERNRLARLRAVAAA